MISGVGFFKLHRELFNKPIWLNSTPEQKTVLITILAMVNFRENEWEWKGKKFKTKPGQTVTSLDKIKQACGKGVSQQNVRTALKRLEKLEFLTNESTKDGRLVTIVNWALYQVEEKNQQSNQQSPNIELTDDQQTPNKDLTPKEEGKKVLEGEEGKEGKDKITISPVPPKHGDGTKYYKASCYLRKKILETHPGTKVPKETPKALDNWSDDLRKLCELDKRTMQELRIIIDYTFDTDDFWCNQIFSAGKLRDKYDQIHAKMKGSPTKSESFIQSATEGKMKNFIERHMND